MLKGPSIRFIGPEGLLNSTGNCAGELGWDSSLTWRPPGVSRMKLYVFMQATESSLNLCELSPTV